MNRFIIFTLIYVVFWLYKDFKNDKGLHIKAKIFHSILIFLLMSSFAGSFARLGWTIGHMDKIIERFGVDVGIVPGPVHLIIYFVNLVLSLTILVLAYQMVRRKDMARKLFMNLFPILALTTVFNIYRGWLSETGGIELSDLTIFIGGFIVMSGISFLYLKIYSSKWMVEFFNQEFEEKKQPNT